MVVPEGLRIKYFVLHDHTCSVSIEKSVNKDETGVRRSRDSYKSKLSLIEGSVSVCVRLSVKKFKTKIFQPFLIGY